MNKNAEIANERISKYMERIEDKPRNKNQLLIKNGEAVLVIDGEQKRCIKVEGYIKFSKDDKVVSISQGNYAFFILPREKMIIIQDDKYMFLGYKTNNTKGGFMLIHAVTELDDLLIVQVDDNIPVLISIDEFYDEKDSFNARIYQILYTLIQKNLVNTNIDMTNKKEEEDDEWE